MNACQFVEAFEKKVEEVWPKVESVKDYSDIMYGVLEEIGKKAGFEFSTEIRHERHPMGENKRLDFAYLQKGKRHPVVIIEHENSALVKEALVDFEKLCRYPAPVPLRVMISYHVKSDRAWERGKELVEHYLKWKNLPPNDETLLIMGWDDYKSKSDWKKKRKYLYTKLDFFDC